MRGEFTGTFALLSLALRRDRVVIPAWSALYLAYTVGGTAAAVALYPDLQSRIEAATAVNNMPALVAMYGRVWDPTSIGSVAMMKPIGFGGIFAAVFAILLVVRHTRAEEESGRLELVAAQPVGSLAPAASTLLLVAGLMTVFAIINGFGVAAAGLPSRGAWAFALSVSFTGLHFGAIATWYVQITQSARTASTLALCELALAFVLRGTADAAGNADGTAWWGWLSPLGWQAQVRPFASDTLGPLLLFIASLVILVPWAMAMSRARDHDAGLLPQRTGRASASPRLRSVFALALRLQRGLLTGLVLTYAFMSLLLGAIVSNIDGMLSSPDMQEFVRKLGGGGALVDSFTSFELSFAAVMTAVCGITLARRFGIEEQVGRIEPLLATAVSRPRVLGAFVAVTLLGTAMLQLVLGLGFGLANGAQLHDYSALPRTVGAALVYLPAIWVVVGIAYAVLAFAPAWTNLGWLVIGGLLLLEEFGPMFSWPAALLDLSPFHHVPHMPSAAMAWTPTLLLTATAAALGILAFTQYRRRDLATP